MGTVSRFRLPVECVVTVIDDHGKGWFEFSRSNGDLDVLQTVEYHRELDLQFNGRIYDSHMRNVDLMRPVFRRPFTESSGRSLCPRRCP
jgi:hypothetical protein